MGWAKYPALPGSDIVTPQGARFGPKGRLGPILEALWCKRVQWCKPHSAAPLRLRAMVIASPELGCAYDAAGSLPGEKHAPSNAAAVERQQRVIAARLTALAEKDPLKPVSTGGRVDRRPAWRLAAPRRAQARALPA